MNISPLTVVAVLQGFVILSLLFWNHRLRDKLLVLLLRSPSSPEQGDSTGWIVADVALDGVIVVDPDGAMRFRNRSAEALFDWSPGEANGAHVRSIFPETPKKPPFFGSAGLKPTKQRVEVTARNKHGGTFPAWVAVREIKWTNGKWYYVFYISDISAWHRERNELSAKELQYRSLFELSRDAMTIASESGFVDCNQAALDMFGYADKTELCKLHPADVSPSFQPNGRDSASYARELICQGSARKGGVFEWVHKRKDGSEFCCEILLSPTMLADGRRVVQGVLRDITERKRANDALKQAKQEADVAAQLATEFRALADASGQVIGMADLEGCITYVNLPLLKHWRLKDDRTVLGRHILDLAPESLRAKLVDEIFPALNTKGQWIGEISYERSNGDLIHTMENYFVVRNTAGEPHRLANIVLDITDRKLLEGELRQAKEDAEAAARSKSAFLANMSHEIRTPMNAIIGFTDWLLETELSDFQKEKLCTIDRSAKNLLRLLNDVLDSAKLESGGLTLEKVVFSLPAVVDDLMATFSNSAAEKGLRLNSRIAGGLPQFYLGDAMRLSQILTNLIGNAIKFTESGHVELEVVPWEREGVLHFAIEDTGIGIEADRLPDIFDPFTQADASMTRRFGGTGLGTTICRQLVEIMGGQIWVESAPGEGSVFHFTVALKVSGPPKQDPDHQVTKVKPLVQSGTWRSLNILLAEDLPENAELVTHRLRQWGHEVVHVRDGIAAVNRFRSGGFDLILMDVQMPHMDGLEATKAIRAHEIETGGHIPIIALTASVLVEDRLRFKDVGMDGFVAKPIDFVKLFTEIQEVTTADADQPFEVVVVGGEPEDDESQEVSDDDNQTGLLDEIKETPGLDLKAGLRLWRDPLIYNRNLKRFMENNRDFVKQLRLAMETGDWLEMRELNHAVKGVTGNLALPRLHVLSKQLGNRLRNEEPAELNGLLNEMEIARREAFASIVRASLPSVETERDHTSDDRAMQSWVLELSDALGNGENPVRRIVLLMDALKERVPDERLQRLSRAVDDFEMEEARNILLEIAQEIENVGEGA